MADWRSLERRLTDQLRVSRRPVAVAFLDREPTGLMKFNGSEPSGCSFWRLASAGATFYTVPSDHNNCAVGAYTHRIALAPERANELEQTLGLMLKVGYIRAEEVAGIHQLPSTPRAIVYSPLAEAPVDPSVVLFACQPAAAMLLNEAAMSVGVGSGAYLLGRPTCMALPAAMANGAVTSLGCIGNRVYTDLADDELYTVVSGAHLVRVAEAVEAIVAANSQLAEYAQQRRQQLSQPPPPQL